MRILGVDPGMTRCGVGVIDTDASRAVSLVGVHVIRTAPDLSAHHRLAAIYQELSELVATYRPDSIAVERIFAEQNMRSVVGTAQVAGLALLIASQRGCRLGEHSPSEVKSAIASDGRAGKKQVQLMVQRILRLKELPRPADAADALALAICHAWRPVSATAAGPLAGRGAAGAQHGGAGSLPDPAAQGLTAAQRQWAQAARDAKRSGAAARRPT